MQRVLATEQKPAASCRSKRRSSAAGWAGQELGGCRMQAAQEAAFYMRSECDSSASDLTGDL